MPDVLPISVIMPVYNGAEHLAESIDSILTQSFVNFEFIIIDDASTDATTQILADYAAEDDRIRVLTNGLNAKIAVSLNRGLEFARAPLIARMDADDWSHPERLAKQYAFMQANPDVTVCGTWLETYETGEQWKYPVTNSGIRKQLFFGSAFGHPTVMFRKARILHCGGYAASMPPAEDYDLWVKLAADPCTRFANIDEVLLRYRIKQQPATVYYDAMHRQADVVRNKLCKYFWGDKVSDANTLSFHTLFTSNYLLQGRCDSTLDSIYSMLNQNEITRILTPPDMVAQLCTRWGNICMALPITVYPSLLLTAFQFLCKKSDALAWGLIKATIKSLAKRIGKVFVPERLVK